MNGIRPRGMYAIGHAHFEAIFPSKIRKRISELLTIIEPSSNPELLGDLSDVEVLFTGWDAPRLTGEVLDRMPKLRLVLHAAGSVRHVVSDEVWNRGIRIVSAAAANAVPVADFTVSQIILSLKDSWRTSLAANRYQQPAETKNVRGVMGATIGIAGMGLIGRKVASRLQSLDVNVIAYDPYADSTSVGELGVRLVDLDELFLTSDVVTLHTPLLDSTRRMFGRRLLQQLRPHATLINTARGALIPTDELEDVLRQRPDLVALLDVTDPEPLPDGHPLFSLPNVVLTPHIAGSLGSELALMGALVTSELERYLSEDVLLHELTFSAAALTA